MKRLFFTAIMAVVVLSGFSQIKYQVGGVIADSVGEPEAFATVRIYSSRDTSKVESMGVTKDDGSFSLSLKHEGNYLLKITSVGRKPLNKPFNITHTQPKLDFGTLTIGDDDNLLGEVTVTAVRPLVSKEIDRIGYDVQADEESKTTTLDEILRKVPLVSVDPDGTIKVKGSSDFKIYKNGRPNNSFTKNSKEIFKAIPASMIKKIEVITDPGAREDAEGVGAILNIVTLENTVVKGVMGNISLNYDTRNNYPSPNFWGSGQIDRLMLSAYVGMSPITRRSSKSRNESEIVFDQSGNTQLDSTYSSRSGSVTWFGIDASYELDSLNLFTAEFGGYTYSLKGQSESLTGLYSPSGSTIYQYRSSGKNDPTRYLDFNGSFNYQHSTHRRGEALTLSYQVSTTNQRDNSSSIYSNMQDMPVPYTGIVSDSRLNFIEHTLQFDWSRPFAKIHVVDLGLKYINRRNHSRTHTNYLDYEDQPMLDFKHTTQVAAVYADYRVALKRFSLRAGLRYEFSRLSAHYADEDHESFSSNLSDFVPNAAISYKINDANNLKLSYGTRINRPGISYLNPAINQSPTSFSQGNPDLSSARNSSYTLNYSLIGQKFNLDFTAGYSFTGNDIVQVQYIENDRFYSTFANAGHNKSVDLGLFAQLAAGRKTSLMLNVNASYRHFDNPDLNITNHGWGVHAFFRLQQQLPWQLRGSIMTSIWTGNVGGLYSTSRPDGIAVFDYGLSLQRSFLKEDRLTVRFSTWDPFYPRWSRYRTDSYNLPTRQHTMSYNYSTPSIQIGISYRFGSLNAQVKKTARQISNDDLTGQPSGGGSSSSKPTE